MGRLMGTDTASLGKLLIAFTAGVVVTVVAAGALWNRSPSAQASTNPQPAITAQASDKPEESFSNTELCKVVSEYARTVMDGRQAGVPMSGVMDLAKDVDPAIAPVMHQMIMDAYDRPRMSVEKNQQTATRDFENDAYLACMKGSR
ncbi:hypothetical protein ACNJRW_09525 [Stenotrophomonas maltophilia]